MATATGDGLMFQFVQREEEIRQEMERLNRLIEEARTEGMPLDEIVE